MRAINKNKATEKILSYLLVAGVGLLGLFGIWLVWSSFGLRSSQDIRQQASSGNNKVVVRYGNLNYQPVASGGLYGTANLLLNTNGAGISAVQIFGSITGMPSSEIFYSAIDVSGLSPVVQTITPVDNGVNFSLVFFSTLAQESLYSNNSVAAIGRFRFRTNQDRTVTLALDQSNTLATSYQNNFSMLVFGPETHQLAIGETSTGTGGTDNGGGEGEKKSCDENCATDTECESRFVCYEGRCRLPDDTSDAQCQGTPDLGLNRTCNEWCADSNECDNGFECYYNFCRNPQNLEAADCSDPAPTPAQTPVVQYVNPPVDDSTQPKGGTTVVASPSPSPVGLAYDFEVATPRGELEDDSLTQATGSGTPRPKSTATVSAELEGRSATPTPTTPQITPIPESATSGRRSPLSIALGIGGVIVLLGVAGGAIWWLWQNR